jgi:XTP/dITP diphosphohydrolase
VIALNHNGSQYLFTGIAKGEITNEKMGIQGFGYDPIFRPDSYQETFAQLDLNVKNAISHRGKATQELINFLSK